MQYFLKASAGEPIRPAPAGAMPPPTVVASTVANVGTSLPSAPSTAQTNSPAALANATTDPYWSNVSLLLTGDDLLDKSSGNTVAVTAYGNTVVDTTTVKYGSGSLKFDGTGDYLTIPASTSLDFGTEDFTLELWFYHTGAFSTNNDLISSLGYYTNGKNGNWMFNVRNSTAIAFAVYNGTTDQSGGMWDYSVPTITTDTWHHLALVRSGTAINIFLDGVKSPTTGTLTSEVVDGGASGLKIGGLAYPNNTYWNGFIDDLRITKGVARYTQDFVPPMRALPVG